MIRVDTRAIVAGMLDELPNTFRTTWLESAWSGAHGSAGLHTDITHVASGATIREQSFIANAVVAGDVRAGSGEIAGNIERSVSLHPDGTLQVLHDELRLAPHAQGTGFATGLNETAFARYAAEGVQSTKVHAGYTVGGYPWAKQGFELETLSSEPGERVRDAAKTIRGIFRDASEKGRISPIELHRMRSRLYEPGKPITAETLTSVQEVAAIPDLGKRVLAGSNWTGVKPIDATTPWWRLTRAASRNPSGVDDAMRGAAALGERSESRAAMAQARVGVEQLLPEIVRPKALSDTLVGASVPGSVSIVPGREASTRISFTKPSITATVRMLVRDGAGHDRGTLNVTIRDVADGSLAATVAHEGGALSRTDAAALNASLADSLAGAGVDDATITIRKRSAFGEWLHRTRTDD